MNTRIKALWLAALRSGEFTQIRDALHRQRTAAGEWCALGVLCELHRQEFGGMWAGPDGRGDFYYLGNSSYLPQAVYNWAEMQVNAPINIVELNKTLTFAGIADQIEAHL